MGHRCHYLPGASKCIYLEKSQKIQIIQINQRGLSDQKSGHAPFLMQIILIYYDKVGGKVGRSGGRGWLELSSPQFEISK